MLSTLKVLSLISTIDVHHLSSGAPLTGDQLLPMGLGRSVQREVALPAAQARPVSPLAALHCTDVPVSPGPALCSLQVPGMLQISFRFGCKKAE